VVQEIENFATVARLVAAGKILQLDRHPGRPALDEQVERPAWLEDHLQPHTRRRILDPVMGTKVGRWPVDLLASPGEEIVSRLAVLTDTDKRDGEPVTPPVWITDRDSTAVYALGVNRTPEIPAMPAQAVGRQGTYKPPI
jgi:hypothetical protein